MSRQTPHAMSKHTREQLQALYERVKTMNGCHFPWGGCYYHEPGWTVLFYRQGTPERLLAEGERELKKQFDTPNEVQRFKITSLPSDARAESL